MLRSGAVSSAKLTGMMFDRIAALDEKLNAFITLTPELAERQARQADRELAAGIDRGPLHGIPVAIKDLFETAGVRTTGGSRHFQDWIPDRDATAVSRLNEAGAVTLGKTGMHELAWGSTSVNPFFGAVLNPWCQERHPGGSSGGSATAVAAGLAFAALGSDTGCSIRQPAHCCGIVGHKPTFGLVSKSGAIPLVRSMDHVGPLTRCVADASTVLQAIAGYDNSDPYSVDRPPERFDRYLAHPIAGRVVGIPKSFFFEGGDEEVLSIVETAIRSFEDLGASLVDVEIKDIDIAYDAAAATFAEVYATHGRAWLENPDAFSESIHHSMKRYEQQPASDYIEAQNFRQGFKRQMEDTMRACDVLVAPTSTVTAGLIDEDSSNQRKERWKNTGIFDFTGQPSLSVPCGFTAARLPVGLMVSGNWFEDARVFQFAHAYEHANNWSKHHPELP